MNRPESAISRRHFLKSACLAGGALALGGLVPLPGFAGQSGNNTSYRGQHTARQTRLLMGTLVTLTAVAPDAARADAAFALAFAAAAAFLAATTGS